VIRPLLLALLLLAGPACAPASDAPPNFIVILVDDLGYGDIGPFGSKRNRTPRLDEMAAEGMRLTSFYVSASACSPSRASLLTGSYHRRVSIDVVLKPGQPLGLHPDEITLAEVLKQRGYATACIGKWHLGDQRPFLPTNQGFDEYFGLPYSHDMGRKESKAGSVPLPLMRGESVLRELDDPDVLAEAYTREAIRFIEDHRERPFFLYLAHNAVHRPFSPGKRFRGRSRNGPLGDWIEEVDWSTGRILETLRKHGLHESTLVVFTSDNGAVWGEEASSGPLRGRKGFAYEGGMRVPTLAWWPGTIPAGSSNDEITHAMDLMPTFAAFARAELPEDRTLDGRDIGPILRGEEGAVGHRVLQYWNGPRLQAVRSGRWKLVLSGKGSWELYDLARDIGESRNVAAGNPDVLERLEALFAAARAELGDAGPRRPPGFVWNPRPLIDPHGRVRADARPPSEPAGPR
jgi:arylsulfatase A